MTLGSMCVISVQVFIVFKLLNSGFKVKPLTETHKIGVYVILG